MSTGLIRKMLGTLLLFGALLVILPGLNRLFVQEMPAAAPPRIYSAILTDASQGQSVERAAQTRGETRPVARRSEGESACAARAARVTTDANGNVLTEQTYCRSVPEAFVPEGNKT